MTKLPVVTPLQKDDVHAAIAKTNTFADALDQVFKKTVVAECLLMAALSHYDDATGLTSERLDAYVKAITNDLLNAKRTLMTLKVQSKSKSQ